MSDNRIARVSYFDQQFLRAEDFSDEQAYHLAMHRRHNIGGHIWGIVYGLRVVQDKEGTLTVEAGFAIDGYGRELVLANYRSIPAGVFDDRGSETLEVWLEYAQQEGDSAPPGYKLCKPNGKRPPFRLEEMAQVEVRVATQDLTAGDLALRRQPPEVPPEDLRFDPSRLPPDDPRKRWPVFLGQIRRIQGSDKPSYEIDLTGRPYAGLVGETVRAPSGRAWMQIGEDAEQSESGMDYRFGIYLPTNGHSKPAPRLAIDKDGNTDVRGDATVYGDVIVDGGAVEFGVGPAYSQPRPWSIYLAEPTDEAADPENPDPRRQLRIEMRAQGSEAGMNRVVVGAFSKEENRFVPCLSVLDSCEVIVHRDLIVTGDFLVKGNTPTSPHAVVHAEMLKDEELFKAALTEMTHTAEGYAPGSLTAFELQDDQQAAAALRSVMQGVASELRLFEDLVGVVKEFNLKSVVQAVLDSLGEKPGPEIITVANLGEADTGAETPSPHDKKRRKPGSGRGI